MVIFSVKLWDTAAAAEAVRPLLGPDTAVISFQNGVVKEIILVAASARTPSSAAPATLPPRSQSRA